MGIRQTYLPLFFFVFMQQAVHAQVSNSGQPSIDITNLIPKSPQADQLVKVNEINVNMARGVPNISFTLYTASVGSVKIPVTISYDASGVKFDDVPSSVGLKWTLQTGGEISRNINGRSDDSGYFANATTYSNENFAGWNIYTDTAQTFLSEVANNQTDVSQDEYSYNYLDRSGYIYYRNGKLLDLAAPFTHRIQTDTPFSLNNVRFTDEEGNTAYFAGGQDRTYMTLTGSGYYSPYVPPFGVTSWKMSKLQTYTGENATFDYDTAGYEIVKTQQESYSYRQPIGGPPGTYTCNCGTSSLNESGSDAVYNISLVKDIYTPNETVRFFYHTDNSLGLYTRRLDSIVVKDNVFQKMVKKIGFKYGKYATVNYLRLDTLWQYGSTGDSLLIAAFHYNTGGLIGLSSFARDIFGYNNSETNTYLISTNDANYPYTSADRDINPLSVGSGVLDSITYPTGGKVAFFYSANQYTPPSGSTSYGPGVRVDSIKYFNYDYSLQSEMTYSYGAGGGDYVYQNGGYLNNISINSDNSICQVKTIGSELPVGVNLATPWYYSDVTSRKIGATPYTHALTKDFFSPDVNGYGKKNNFLTTERIYFRNNNLYDTLKIENYNYTAFGATDIDSMTVEWLKPGTSFLPTMLYYLDGTQYNNYGTCNVLYNIPSTYGPIIPRKSLLLSTQTTEFDQLNASKKITTTISTAYNSNWQKINDTKINSKGTVDSTVYTYLYTDAGSLTTAVTAGNLFAPINKTTSYTNSAYLGYTQTAFTTFNSLVLPDTVYYQQYASPSVLEGTVTGYDSLGRITEINKKAGFYSCLLRDYGNQSVIASTTNARLSDVAYTSFEADGKGTWTIGSANRDSTTSLTGNKSYRLNSDISRSGLSSGTTYIVSYWTRNSSPLSITGTISGYPIKGKSVVLNDSTWTYYEHKVTGQTTISLSGTGLIDELRLYPDGGQMSTLTYNPLVGVSSQCDVDNRVTYYYYDGFNRLRYIKDQDGNILKTYQYHYITQPN